MSVQDIPKRGRKTKVPTEIDPSKPQSKRGRKPKYVYNTFEVADVISANSEDENVILNLNINNIQDDVSICDDVSLPDAYNQGSCESFLLNNNMLDINMMNAFEEEPLPSNGLKVLKLLKDFEEKNKNNEWPNTTSICCYWCCHRFDNPPFGLPINYVDSKFKVFGCFCSLECAAAFNFDTKDCSDEVWERNNYINMLSRKIDYKNAIKPAPNRLVLKSFGGYLNIDEFRQYCESSKIININFPPMMTLTQQIEEINESDINSEFKYIPIDTDRINRYKEKIKLKRTKPITEFKNTLDHAMNLKID